MSELESIGLYKQLTPFTNENAGTSEYCKVEKDGQIYFAKKLMSPVYPSKDIGLPEYKYKARMKKFHEEQSRIRTIYNRLKENDRNRTLVVPVEVMVYQYHIVTIAEYINRNLNPIDICKLSEWQRIDLMQKLAVSLQNIHNMGVVHSDLKPDNILIIQNPADGRCLLKLIDFDGSFLEKNPPKLIKGDQAFFPPEVFQRELNLETIIDHRIDIFALGLIFHYFWCGKLPENPSKMTMGQYLLEGQNFLLDQSLPPKLRNLILGTLIPAAKRIGCEQIIKELNDLLKIYPARQINLQQRFSPYKPTGIIRYMVSYVDETTGQEILTPNYYDIPVGSQRVIYPKIISGYQIIPENELYYTVRIDANGNAIPPYVRIKYRKNPPLPKYAALTVHYEDNQGKKLLPDNHISIPFGKSLLISPEFIKDYINIETEQIKVFADDSGHLSTDSITFHYKKESRRYLFPVLFVCFFFMYLTFSYLASHILFRKQYYEHAYRVMSFSPLYSKIFHDEYLFTQQQINNTMSDLSEEIDNILSGKVYQNQNQDQTLPQQVFNTVEENNALPPVSLGTEAVEKFPPDEIDIIKLDNIRHVPASNGETKYFRLTAEQRKGSFNNYCFTSFGSADTIATLYDSEWNELAHNNDGGHEKNFGIWYHFNIDHLQFLDNSAYYYLAVQSKNGNAYDLGVYNVLFINEPAFIDVGDSYHYFIPMESREYTFESANSNVNPYGILTNREGKELARDYDSGDGHNFLLKYRLEQGSLYIIYTKLENNSTSGVYNIKVY